MEDPNPAPRPDLPGRIARYIGLVFAETAIAGLLIFAHLFVAALHMFWDQKGGAVGPALMCAMLGGIFAGGGFLLVFALLFVLAKAVYFAIPERYRWVNLALYWGLAGALNGAAVLRTHDTVAFKAWTFSAFSIPALVLTLSYFVFIPRFDPAKGAMAYLRPSR